jgi:serine/threonine-protein kinase
MIGKIVSHYRIMEKLGHGGMGMVHKAEDTRLKRTVALKFLPPELTRDETAKKRFMHEAQAASALDHNNICNIHEIDETDEGRLFIVMSCYEGQSLQEKMEDGPLRVEEAIGIANQTAQGLAKAHSEGIVHRDIKPANIMVTKDGIVKIVDFGLAKLRGHSRLTKGDSTVGTIAYMSPEQGRGEDVDHRTDIWSLGVVLYQMLSGKQPFRGEYEQAVIYSILNTNPDPLAGLPSQVSQDVEKIVDKCLEKEETQRYESAGELEAELRRMMHNLGFEGIAPPVLTTAEKRDLPLRMLGKLASPLAWASLTLLLLLLIVLVWRPVRSWLGFEKVPTQKHLTVLPLTNVGDNPDNQAFCDGLVETLTSKLTQLEPSHGALLVVPATDVREHGISSVSEAKKTFGVNLAVTGSVQRIDAGRRLTLNLVDANNLRQLSSSVIDDQMSNVFILQDQSVIKIAEMLNLELRPDTRQILTVGDPAVPGAYEFYLQGRGYLQRYEKIGNLIMAISLFKRAIKQDSLYALAYAGLGEAYWRRYELTKSSNWVEEARSYSNHAIQINDQLAPVHVTLGIIYVGTGRYDDAIKKFRQALQQDPRNSDALLQLAKALDNVGRATEAEDTYKKAIESRPAYWAGYNRLGNFYYKHGRYAEAQRMFRQVTELTPDNARGYYNRGAMYYLMGQYDLAVDLFEESIAIDPTSSTGAYSNLGTLYSMQARYADAVPMYEEATRLGKDDYRMWGNLADAYRYSPGYSEEAREAYQRAVQLAEEQLVINPKDAKLRSSLSVYYASLGENNKAQEEITEALEQAPEDVRVLFKRVLVYEFAKLRDEALAALKTALEHGYSISEVSNHPDLSELRKDPQYQQLVMTKDSDSSAKNEQ